MILLFAFLIHCFAASKNTTTTEAIVFSACEESLPGLNCSQKYQSPLKITDTASTTNSATLNQKK